MDPLSVIASIGGLPTLVAKTILLSREYVTNVKNSKETASAFAVELEAFSSNLVQLKHFLQEDASKAKTFGQTSMLMTCTSSTEHKLQDLNEKLDRVRSNKWKQALWPFTEKEHHEVVRQLRVFSQWIHFSLAIDSSALLSKSLGDIAILLEEQLKSVQLLDSLHVKTSSMQADLETQTELIRTTQQNDEREKILR